MSIAAIKALVSRRELGLGGIYALTLAALWQGQGAELALGLALIPLLIWLSTADLTRYELPDVATGGVALASLIFLVAVQKAVAWHLATGVMVGAVMWLIGELIFRKTGEEGLGIGDAKLFGAGAFLLGPEKLPELVLFSSIGGIVAAVLQTRRGAVAKGIPFGPFIAYAMYILFFLEPIFL